MGLLSQPTLLVEIALTKFPASLGTETVRLTRVQRPVSLPARFYEPRIKAVSPVRRSCTDPDGNYAVGDATFVLADDDGQISELLRESVATEYWDARELTAWIISREGLDAGLTTDDVPAVFRGWITDVQKRRREVDVTAADVLGSQMSGYNLDKKVLQTAVRHLNPNARDEDKDIFIPIYFGEFSKAGLLDANGEDADNGLVPAIEVGYIGETPTFADPPVITESGVVGTTGELTLYYAASVITSYGESRLSNVVGLSGASARSMSHYNWIAGTYDSSGGNKVRIWVSADGVTFSLWLDEADYFSGSFGYADGAKLVTVVAGVPSVSRDELDVPKSGAPPTTNQAETTGAFSVMALCLGYDYRILNLFGSNLADGAEPKRVALPAADYSATTITSDDAGWPFPNPWIELNGVIFTGFLQRGPKLNHHRDRSVTMAADLCGPHTGGLLVNQAFRQFPMLLNEYCFKNKGTGWRNQTYGTLETFANGDAMLQTTTFEACQDLSKTFLGNSGGYIGHIWIVDPNETWRDVHRKFCLTFGARGYVNRFGQSAMLMINTMADAVLGRHFRERIEIARSEEPRLAHDEVINSFVWSCFYDVDAATYLAKGTTENAESIAAHVPGGVVGGSDRRGLRQQVRELAYTSDLTTANDAINRELTRRARRPRYPVITVPLLGLDHDLGGRGRLTDTEGLGTAGDVAAPVVILEHETRLDEREVTLTLQILAMPFGTMVTSEDMGLTDTVATSELPRSAQLSEGLRVTDALTVLRLPLQPAVGILSEGVKISQTVSAQREPLEASKTETARLSDVVIASLGEDDMVLLEEHIASSSASLDFTTCISVTYDEYLIEIVNLAVATDSVDLYLRLSTDGGSSYVSTNSYRWNYSATNLTTTSASGSAADSGMKLANSINNTANWSVSGSYRFYNPGGSTYKAVTGQGSARAAGAYYSFMGMSGLYEATTPVNALRVIASSGNLASGVVRIYGLKKV